MTTATDLTIRPFEVHVPEEDLADLQRRIAATRLPSKELVDDRSQGVQLATIQQLDDRAGPAVCHDQRQRALVRRLQVDEVNVHPVDLCRKLRQRVQLRLARAPVIIGRPVAGQLLDDRL